MYYFRVRVQGRLIRRSPKTDGLSVAKLRLNDEEKKQRQAPEGSSLRARFEDVVGFVIDET